MTKTNLKYFTLDEFDSPDLPNSGINMDSDFLQKLEADSRSRFIIISALLSAGFNRIGIASTFIHCDTAEKGKTKNVIWTY